VGSFTFKGVEEFQRRVLEEPRGLTSLDVCLRNELVRNAWIGLQPNGRMLAEEFRYNPREGSIEL
jgi:hypothetical protein